MKDNRKAVHAVTEILLAAALIVAIFFLIRYMDVKDAKAAEAAAGTETQKWIEFPEDTPEVTLGSRTYVFSHPVKTYLLMGTDASGNEDAIGDEYQGSMADTLMLVMVDDEEKSYGILQLNRDTITDVPILQDDGTSYASAEEQLCTAHWYGKDKKASCENTVQAVSNMLGGLPIDGYYSLQMEAMPLLNEAVDGVTITFSENMTEIDPLMKKGATLTLTDEQAEALLHTRMGLEDDRNSERMRRQKLFMDGFMDKMKQKAVDTNFTIELYDRLHPYATEDININELSQMLKNMKGYTNKGTFTIDGTSKLGEKLGDGEKHWEFYMDEGSLDSTMCGLYPLVYQKEQEDGE